MLNKNMKSLSMVRVNLQDEHGNILVEPLCRSMNLEYLKLEFNLLKGEFVTNYCNGLSKIGFTPINPLSGIAGAIERNASASLLASESEEVSHSGAISRRSSHLGG